MSGYLSRSLRAAFVIGAVLTLVGLGQSAPSVDAAAFTVTKTADTADGTCDADCSLREAIIAANAAAGADTVAVPAGTYNLTIAGTDEDAAATGDLDITDDLILTGAGAGSTVIDGGALDRVLDVDPSASAAVVEVTGVTVQNGNTADSGAGVRNRGSLALTGSEVTSNVASITGGGIENEGELTANSSTITGNTSALVSGGIQLTAGSSMTMVNSEVSNNDPEGIILDGGSSASITSSVISGNTGGGFSVTGTLVLSDSVVRNNSALGNGGGIGVPGGTVTVTGSTLSGNSAIDGGAIFSNGTVELTNSTISGNTATGLGGGGILNNVVADLTATSVTVAGNSPDGIHSFGSATVTNTVVADGCAGPSAITSGGHNLDNDGSCAFGAAGDATGDPRLSALADNGGPTQTHALQAESPAIDAADDVNCPLVDQRGVARPVDGDLDGTATCDIGAYELEVATATPTPTPAPTPAELPETGAGPAANGGGVMAIALPLLAAAAFALGTWCVVMIMRQQRGRR